MDEHLAHIVNTHYIFYYALSRQKVYYEYIFIFYRFIYYKLIFAFFSSTLWSRKNQRNTIISNTSFIAHMKLYVMYNLPR